ncbi:MAG: MoxR family ATPase [Rhodospirillaceae bacterium]|nr:MoxR family ATPase [Rhodospirillaceae bacterium]
MNARHDLLGDRDRIARSLVECGYVPDGELPTALWLMGLLGRPLLLEGEAGVGKTEVAKALAALLATRLIRLQCYEGLDQQSALYEWNYQRQLLAIKAREGQGDAAAVERLIFSEEYLLERPLLTAIRQNQAPVLLIDEIDRADQEFEALLLELLSDFQISIPELGTVTARARPFVILTSNGTRDLSDALRRRCLYHHIDYPDPEREARIIRARLPGIDSDLAAQIADVVGRIRKESLAKVPGVAETLDWAAALMGLGIKDLGANIEAAYQLIATLIKTQEDRAALPCEVWVRLLERVA